MATNQHRKPNPDFPRECPSCNRAVRKWNVRLEDQPGTIFATASDGTCTSCWRAKRRQDDPKYPRAREWKYEPPEEAVKAAREALEDYLAARRARGVPKAGYSVAWYWQQGKIPA